MRWQCAIELVGSDSWAQLHGRNVREPHADRSTCPSLTREHSGQPRLPEQRGRCSSGAEKRTLVTEAQGRLVGWQRMEVLLVAGMLVLMAGGYLAARGLRIAPLPQGPRTGTILASEGRADVYLAIGDGTPSSPSVERLVRDAAARAFASMPNLSEVIVRSRNGDVLGQAQRAGTASAAIVSDPVLERFPAHPFGLAHPHRPVEPEEDLLGQVIEHVTGAPSHPRQAGPERRRVRPLLTGSLELPAAVREQVAHPDDPVDVVRVLLLSAGLPALVDRDVVASGDRAIVVLGGHVGDPVTPGMLDHAYLRFRESDAARGVVVSPGVMPLGETRRREMLDPSLLHAGLDGIQRMADAVVVGADPIDFAAAPALADS
jgi:hypothetical protein